MDLTSDDSIVAPGGESPRSKFDPTNIQALEALRHDLYVLNSRNWLYSTKYVQINFTADDSNVLNEAREQLRTLATSVAERGALFFKATRSKIWCN